MQLWILVSFAWSILKRRTFECTRFSQHFVSLNKIEMRHIWTAFNWVSQKMKNCQINLFLFKQDCRFFLFVVNWETRALSSLLECGFLVSGPLPHKNLNLAQANTSRISKKKKKKIELCSHSLSFRLDCSQNGWCAVLRLENPASKHQKGNKPLLAVVHCPQHFVLSCAQIVLRRFLAEKTRFCWKAEKCWSLVWKKEASRCTKLCWKPWNGSSCNPDRDR